VDRKVVLLEEHHNEVARYFPCHQTTIGALSGIIRQIAFRLARRIGCCPATVLAQFYWPSGKLSGSKTFACRRGQFELLDDGKCSFDDEAREMLFVLYEKAR
jgi:hypothetical protein